MWWRRFWRSWPGSIFSGLWSWIMTYKFKLKVILLGLLVVVILVWLVPWSTGVPLSNGGRARITKAPLLRALFPEANTKILYEPKGGKAGSIALWQDLFDGPVFIFSGNDSNILLCLYDYDVHYCLFKIDTSKLFKPVPTNSDLKNVLFTSTWQIQDGEAGDWKEVLNYLYKAPRSLFVQQSVRVGVRFNQNPESIIKRLAFQGITTNCYQ